MSTISGSDVTKIVVACEAGMGSSVMVASMLAKQLKSHNVSVTHSPVNRLLETQPDVVICHRGLAARAKQAVGDIVVIPFDMFLGDPKIQQVANAVLNGTTISDE